MLQTEHITLASSSPARLALLQAAGLKVTACSPQVDEGAIKAGAKRRGTPIETAAIMLAEMKARSINLPGTIIGADQILLCDGEWFDKPADAAAARQHLLRLRGRWHELITAVAVARQGETLWTHVSRPSLYMRQFTDTFLDRYIQQEGSAILGCVGAYRVEGPGIQMLKHIEGEHAAILGLPMLPLLEFLRNAGVLTDGPHCA